MCDCMTKVNEAMKDRNTRLATGFVFTKNMGGMDCLPLMAVEKIDKQSRKKPQSVLPTFCPFCGEQYKREGEEAA